MTIHQSQVPNDRRSGAPGMRADADVNVRALSFINSQPQAGQVDVLTVVAVQAVIEYKVTVTFDDNLSDSFAYTTAAAPTTATLAAGLLAALNARPFIRGKLASATLAGSVLTLTGLEDSPSWTLSITEAGVAGTDITAATTASAEADAVPFGRVLVSTGYIVGDLMDGGTGSRYGTLPKSSVFTAQVDTLTVTYVALEQYSLSIEIEGVKHSIGPILADTDDATTALAIHTALTALIAATGIRLTLAALAGNVITLTSAIAGLSFDLSAWVSTGTGANLVQTTTGGSAATSIELALLGIAERVIDEENIESLSNGDVAYKANRGGNAIFDGGVWVENTQAPSYKQAVYVDMSDSASAGLCYNAAGTNLVRMSLDRMYWLRGDFTDADSSSALLRIAAKV